MMHWTKGSNVRKSPEQFIFEHQNYPQNGSAYWRMTEIFKTKLKADPHGKIFDDTFADKLAVNLKDELHIGRRRGVISFVATIILLSLLTGYELPFSFPYVGNLTTPNQIPHSAFEITLIVFLLIRGALFLSQVKISLFEKLLRTYVDFKYGPSNRDFYLLKWGVDDVTPHIVSEEYDGYHRNGQRGVAFRIFLSAMTKTYIILSLVQIFLVFIGIAHIIRQPAFGWLSFFILAGAFIYFVQSCIIMVSSLLSDKYDQKRS